MHAKAVDPTFILLSFGLVVYIASCALHWRRLNRGDEGKDDTSAGPRPGQ